MKVAHYSASLQGQSAARRLQLALLGSGVDAYAVVGTGASDDIRPLSQSKVGKLFRLALKGVEREVLRKYCGMTPEALWSSGFSGIPVASGHAFDCPDILHLHWVADGTLRLHDIARLGIPMVWTMHDTWPFTAGCHILNGCEGYLSKCECCRALTSTVGRIYAARQFSVRRSLYQKMMLTAVSPSVDYMEKARNSGLMDDIEVCHIPNCIDTSLFRPLERAYARQLLGLPADATLLLFGAVSVRDRHKGMDLALEALRHVASSGEIPLLSCVCFGGGEVAGADELPFSFLHMGRLEDQLTLALAYSAADIFICPSRQESFSQTTLESLSCGTPVVAFSVGGIPDMVEHGVSGWLAAPENVQELAAGISCLLGDAELRERMGRAGREKVEREFSQSVVAAQYKALYERILEERRRGA